jgi:hypothetical protein
LLLLINKFSTIWLPTGNKLKEKSRDLNRNSSRNKNETMFGSGYENCPEFGVLGGACYNYLYLALSVSIKVALSLNKLSQFYVSTIRPSMCPSVSSVLFCVNQTNGS